MAPELAPSTKVASATPSSSKSSTGKGTGRIVFLVDNGSVRAAATLSLRSLASTLQDHLGDGTRVVGVSARWSDRVRLFKKTFSPVGFHVTTANVCYGCCLLSVDINISFLRWVCRSGGPRGAWGQAGGIAAANLAPTCRLSKEARIFCFLEVQIFMADQSM